MIDKSENHQLHYRVPEIVVYLSFSVYFQNKIIHKDTVGKQKVNLQIMLDF